MFPLEALKGCKLPEVVKSSTFNYGSAYSTGFFVVMNKDKWNTLPPDVQKVVEEVNKEWIEKTGKAWDEIDNEGEAVTKEPAAPSAAAPRPAYARGTSPFDDSVQPPVTLFQYTRGLL